MDQLAQQYRIAEIEVEGSPDWQVVAYGSMWIADDQLAQVKRVDTRTNQLVSAVNMTAPCDGMAALDGSVWSPDCAARKIVRIAATSGRVVARVSATPAAPEGYIAAGDGQVWFVAAGGELDGISTASNRIATKIAVPTGAVAVAWGFGSLWVSDPDDHVVLQVDPLRRRVEARIRTGLSPRFLAAGEGAVWVLDQDSGAVIRIDPHTLAVRSIDANSGGQGGCIATGFGAVWVTIPGAPLTRIDASTGKVTAQYQGSGGDCISTGDGSVWLSNNEEGTIWRIRAFH